MPRTDRPYSRVYWEIVDDAKFATVFDDDHALAWWLRLLIAADQAFPTSAMLPVGVHRGGLKRLVDAQLVDVSGSRYRIRGLDAERARRAGQGKAGAAARWSGPPMPGDRDAPAPDSVDDANGYANGSPNGKRPDSGRNARTRRGLDEDETRRGLDEDKTRTSARAHPNGSSGPEKNPVLELQALAEELTGQPYAALNPYAGLGAKAVSEQLQPHGFDRTETAWREVARRHGTTPPTIRQLVLEADDLLNPIARAGNGRAAAAEADDREVRDGIAARLRASRAAKGADA